MLPLIRNPIKELTTIFRKSWKWRIGYLIIGVALVARGAGLFSSLELLALDTFIKYRPAELEDNYITIIGIDSAYIGDRGSTSDGQLVELIQEIYKHQPAVIGINIFPRQSMSDRDRGALRDLFSEHENLIGVEKIFPPEPIAPPQDLPERIAESQFGFSDFSLDSDLRLRRVFLGAFPAEGEGFKKSFSLRVSEIYLNQLDHKLENGIRDIYAMRFNQVEIPRLTPYSGGYVREKNIEGVQTLINFRGGEKPFRVVNASDFMQGRFQEIDIRNRIILIGATDFSNARSQPTAISSSLVGIESQRFVAGILGIELEAHAISQIINAVLKNRPFIRPIFIVVDYFGIAFIGLMGILVGKAFISTSNNIYLLLTLFLGIIGSSYLSLVFLGFWLPVFPATSVLLVTGSTYIAFYQSERDQESILMQEAEQRLAEERRKSQEAERLKDERRRAIERTFGAIHAGPLQTLAIVLRNVRDDALSKEDLVKDLKSLNREIRKIGERLRQEAIDAIYFIGDERLDLMHPLHEVFYEVYSLTLERKLPYFKDLKIRTVSFEPFESQHLSLEIKRKLCWFLEESLCNVGKHAEGVTRLKVSGTIRKGLYSLVVEDNGVGLRSNRMGEGTRSFHEISNLLEGRFSRHQKLSGGTICILTWALCPPTEVLSN